MPSNVTRCQQVSHNYLVKLLYFGMACHYSIAPWYPPYQPFSGIDRAMASWHGWRVMNLFSPKLQVKKSILAIDFIWIRALRLIFSQIYITRHCLSFFRPPNYSRILCFWEFCISGFSVFGFYIPDIGLTENTKKKSDFACFGSWWVQIGSRSRRWDLYRLIVWI